MEKQMGKKIVMIGAGNVAGHLSVALQNSGNQIIQVFSRTQSAAKTLANKLNSSPTNRISQITDQGDLYILAVSDSALPLLIKQLRFDSRLVVHTSGSMNMNVFEGAATNYGVIYPLQTFSKGKMVDFNEVPVIIEGNNKGNEKTLIDMCQQISERVIKLDSIDRLYLHLAAVFACNFTNHLYSLASEILDVRHLSFELLTPLINETAEKVQAIQPAGAQTGPAIRNDQIVIKKHLDLLSFSPGTKELYEKLSQSIYARSDNQ